MDIKGVDHALYEIRQMTIIARRSTDGLKLPRISSCQRGRPRHCDSASATS